MGKPNNEQKSKLMIARDKFCDEDFDKLVIETSHSIASKSLDGLLSPIPPIVQSNSPIGDDELVNSESPSKSNCDHNRLNQPKRPMNAFMVWGQAIRRELHHKFSNVQNALLSKALGRVWRSLDPTEKEPFVRRANLIKANHKRDYPNYRYQPRRMQERRARNNMLIGINLNHPVNQHQPSATYLSNQATMASNHQPAHSSVECHNHLLLTEDNKRSRGSDSIRSLYLAEPRARDLSKETMDGVQTIEYHPYPAPPAEVTIECNNCRPMPHSGCPSDISYREAQLQTSIYSPYQQLTYTTHQNQHHHNLQIQQQQQQQQHQHFNQQHLPQQPFSYEVIQQQSNQMDIFSSGSPTSSNAGLYYAGGR